MQNKLFTKCRTGFIPGESCTARLFSITHVICENFDNNSPYGKRGNFPDILKVFDKVWHDGLMFKFEIIWNRR